MTKAIPENSNPIDRLLSDRAQFVSWLTRLNSSEGVPTVPEAVRSRVRADYERRLESVLGELRGHTAALEEQVTGLSARQSELAMRETEFKEQLSEAEVRHVVGEYDDGKWDGIRAELTKVVLQVREELTHTSGEVARLNDVLALIRAPVLPEQAPEPVPPPPLPSLGNSAPRPAVSGSGPRAAVMAPEATPLPPEPEPARPAASATPVPAPAGGTEIPFRAITPRPAPSKPAPPPPAPKKDEVPGRTLWFPSGKPNEQGGAKLDELAFLKSVTGGEGAAPPPAAPAPPPPAPISKPRPSGGFTRSATIEAPPDPPGPRGTPPPSVDPAKDRQSGQKTLKCAECGTLNRPTEWYCERCGAELAAL
jgi:hypothetical protein